MSENKGFAGKHGAGAKSAPEIREQVSRLADDGQLACAVAFKISKDYGVPPSEVGMAADLLNFRLVKCQLGLFGYQPEKKIVKPLEKVDRKLQDAVRKSVVNGRLPCESAWDIARQLKVRKMTVSSACEFLKIKIKPCQLGAF